MANNDKRDTGDVLFRNVSEFYTIDLERDDYTLTNEILRNCIDNKSLKSVSWSFPVIKLVGYKNGAAEFSNTADKLTYMLYIQTEKDKLHVRCTCGSKVEKLCIHIYKALYALITYGSKNDFFKSCAPNGLAQTSFSHKKYFVPEKYEYRPVLTPKDELGSVFAIKEKLAGYSINDVLALPAQPPIKIEKKDITICYFLMIARRDDLLPFLLPCLGKLNKAGNEIKSFDNFLSGTEKAYEPYLTEAQKKLNAICYEMFQLVEKLPGELIREEIHFNEPNKLSKVFELWQKVFPLLKTQIVYKHPYFQKKQLKKRPSKLWTYKINMQEDKPELQFLLVDKKVFYQLQMQSFINGKAIKNCEIIDEFFIQDMESGNVYLLASLRDAGIAEWMLRSANMITIFKEHFKEFEHSFLNSLQKYYTVKLK